MESTNEQTYIEGKQLRQSNQHWGTKKSLKLLETVGNKIRGVMSGTKVGGSMGASITQLVQKKIKDDFVLALIRLNNLKYIVLIFSIQSECRSYILVDSESKENS